MTKPLVLKACYATWKPVPTRNVLQMTFEVPLEQTQEVMKILGVPTSQETLWCAIARLAENGPDALDHPVSAPQEALPEGQARAALPIKQGKRLKEMALSNQCALMCSDPRFIEWLDCETEAEATHVIREKLKIDSRAKLDDVHFTFARHTWRTIHASFELGEAYIP